MDPGMLEPNGHFLQRPFFPSRIQRDRHGCSTAQCSQEQIVWRRSAIGAAVWNRFVCTQPMATCRDLLREPAPTSSNDDFRFMRCVVNRHLRKLPCSTDGRAKRSQARALRRGPLYAATSPNRRRSSQSARACAISYCVRRTKFHHITTFSGNGAPPVRRSRHP